MFANIDNHTKLCSAKNLIKLELFNFRKRNVNIELLIHFEHNLLKNSK